MVQNSNSYTGSTPEQLNGEFRRLYEQLPTVDPYDLMSKSALHHVTDFMDNDKFRRESSEHRDILLTKLRRLLGLSRATETLKRYIIDEFEATYTTGEIKGASNLYDLLDPDNPESGGIFDPARATVLDLVEYAKRLQNLIVACDWARGSTVVGERERLGKGLDDIGMYGKEIMSTHNVKLFDPLS